MARDRRAIVRRDPPAHWSDARARVLSVTALLTHVIITVSIFEPFTSLNVKRFPSVMYPTDLLLLF